MREPQLVIATPDPCDHYEVTVTLMCGSITGAHTSPVNLKGEFKWNEFSTIVIYTEVLNYESAL